MRKRNWLALFLVTGLFSGQTALAAQGQSADEARAAAKEKKAAAQAGRKLAEPEEISGKISLVDTTDSTVTVTSKGVPYVFRVTKKTKIQINGKIGDLEALAKQVNQNISVRFVPRSGGNFAENVEVKSS